MDFQGYVKSVKADVAKRELTISFTVPMDEESMEMAQDLAEYTREDAGRVDVSVSPMQAALFKGRDVTLTAKE